MSATVTLPASELIVMHRCDSRLGAFIIWDCEVRGCPTFDVAPDTDTAVAAFLIHLAAAHRAERTP